MTSSLPPARLPAAPESRHTPNAISVLIERLPSGGYRLSTPYARGWAAVCLTPMQLANAMPTAFAEVSISAYARAKGAVYDLDQLTGQVIGDVLAGAPASRAKRPRASRRAAHSPADWSMTDTGAWRSPGGRIYGPETLAVQRVKVKRAALGLPT
jgi:hypothetical protein